MKKILGLLLERIQKRKKSFALFVDEIKSLIFAFVLVTIGWEIYMLIQGNYVDISGSSFVMSTVLFFLLYCLFEYLLRIFVDGKILSLIAVIPSIPLVVVYWKNTSWHYLIAAVVVAAVVRLFLCFITWKKELFLYGIYFLDGAALYMWWIYHSFEQSTVLYRLLFACLIVMTLTSLQQVLVERDKGAFPFHFFILLAICVSLLPMKETPIDWTPVKTMMGKLSEASENAVYYLSNSSKSYTTGYSSLNVTGGKIKKSKKTQLSLKTAEAPYYVFTDENTGKQMKMTKVLYLHSENEVDKEQFVSFLQFLYDNDVDASTADIFSQISKVSVEYVYLNTEDEIVPAGTIVIKGNTEGAHKKGYKLDVVYLDIDYGSPYLINLLESSQISSKKMTYEEASRYMKKIYRMDLDAIISEEEYDSLVKDMSIEDALDATGVTTQMQKLAKEITADASTEYDKCKLIETYLRQYRYNVDAVGGYKEDSTMATAEGMADIANRFLFDTKEGYCVHFTSSMVMLLRAAGIPARVETGYRYVYPMEKQEDYIVQASAAHVWPEAYIDGVGWIPFEPTSGYFNADDVSWHRKRDEDAGLKKYKTLETKVVPQLNYASADKEQIDRFFTVIVGLAVALTIVIIIILAVITTIIVRRLKYKYASYEERLKIDVDNIKQIIAKHSNGTIDDRGFLSDYLKLAPDEIYEEVEGAFELYYNLLYGGDSRVAVSEAQSLKVKEISEKLKNIYK